jgi:hypothetical protein
MRGLRGGTVIINMVMRASIALDADRSPNEPCWVVCVDSMDEAVLLRGVSQIIVDLLAATFSRPLRTGWPARVRFLVRTRPQERVVAKLRGSSPDNMSVNAMDERNVDDLRRYVRRRLLGDMRPEGCVFPNEGGEGKGR